MRVGPTPTPLYWPIIKSSRSCRLEQCHAIFSENSQPSESKNVNANSREDLGRGEKRISVASNSGVSNVSTSQQPVIP
jgi:hypothetical protein